MKNLAKANRVGWYGHVLRIEDDDPSRKVRVSTWRARENGDDHGKHGGVKYKRRLEGLGCRRKTPLIKQNGEMV